MTETENKKDKEGKKKMLEALAKGKCKKAQRVYKHLLFTMIVAEEHERKLHVQKSPHTK